MAWAERQPERTVRQGVISGWWDSDPEAAERFALSHLDNFEDGKLAGIIASRIATQDGRRAADWINNLPAEARGLAIIDVAMPWAYRAPREASDWAMTLPPEERATALAAIASQWARNDPAAAGEWLASLNGPGRDQAIATYTNAIARMDPATALSWTATMAVGPMRDNAMEQVIGIWTSHDPRAAREWIERSALTSEQKAKLLTVPPRG